MDFERALGIIQALSQGVDPITGEVLSAQSLFQQPDVIRAMYSASMALESAKKRKERHRQLPQNAGKSWSQIEDEQLLTAFDSGKSLAEIAKAHARTETGIRSRLVRHGKLEMAEGK